MPQFRGMLRKLKFKVSRPTFQAPNQLAPRWGRAEDVRRPARGNLGGPLVSIGSKADRLKQRARNRASRGVSPASGRHAQCFQIVFREVVRRVDLKRLAEISDGLFFVAPHVAGDAPVGVGVGKIRVERDGLGVVRDGAVERALPPVGEAPVGVGEGKIRVERDGLIIVGDGFIMLALVEASPP